MSTPTKRRTSKKLSESEKANLFSDYNEGNHSHTDLSDKYGCSKSSVQRILRNMEINERQRPLFDLPDIPIDGSKVSPPIPNFTDPDDFARYFDSESLPIPSPMSQNHSEYDESSDNAKTPDHRPDDDMNLLNASPDEMIIDALNRYIARKNADKNLLINKYNKLARRFENERSQNQSSKTMIAMKDRKIAELIDENAQLKAKATDGEEEMRKQCMTDMKKLCIRCSSKSKGQFHSMPFCSNKCYSEMAALFQK